MTDQTMNGGDSRPVDRKGVIGWMMFDWATQPFHTLIITFVFAPYFAAHVADNPVRGQEIWGLATGLGGLAIAIMAPVLGAIADSTGPRKPWILAFSFPAVIGCWMLWYALPGGSDMTLVITALILGLIGMEFAAVFNNAMMPDQVPRSHLGRLSGSAWALGYVGGIVSLVIVLGFLAADSSSGKTLFGFTPLFGLDPQTHQGDRASGPLTAIWYLIFVLPMFLFTPDVHRRRVSKGAIAQGLSQLLKTLEALPRERSYFSFLISSMLYRDALGALYAFGGIYAAGVLGWPTIKIGIFGILAATVGVFGAWAGGQIDDRYGPKTVVNIGIALLILCCVLVVSTSPTEVLFIAVGSEASPSNLPDLAFYVAGCLIGAAGGGLQAASRTLLVDQVPDDRVTEAFGLYALSGKATTFIGPLLIAGATGLFDSQRLGITPVIFLFIAGALLLPWVKSAHTARS